jgi:hypothetical protein
MPTCSAAAHGSSDYPVKHRNRSEFVTAETELNAMAAPASIGLSKIPTNGYRNCCRRARVILGDHHRVEAMVWSTSLKPFECDQNLWDAVEVKIGRTQGVESHHTLGDDG